jgi:hypothetical protein
MGGPGGQPAFSGGQSGRSKGNMYGEAGKGRGQGRGGGRGGGGEGWKPSKSRLQMALEEDALEATLGYVNFIAGDEKLGFLTNVSAAGLPPRADEPTPLYPHAVACAHPIAHTHIHPVLFKNKITPVRVHRVPPSLLLPRPQRREMLRYPYTRITRYYPDTTIPQYPQRSPEGTLVALLSRALAPPSPHTSHAVCCGFKSFSRHLDLPD